MTTILRTKPPIDQFDPNISGVAPVTRYGVSYTDSVATQVVTAATSAGYTLITGSYSGNTSDYGYNGSVAASPVSPVQVAAPTGVAATDTAAIQVAINTIATAGGGTVQLQRGPYALSSTLHPMTSVTYSAGTWTVNTGSVPTVGQYIIGPGINGPAPKVLTVTGSTFTTDIPPAGTVTAAAIYSVTPGLVLPDGVNLQGVSSSHGPGPMTGGTVLCDSGTGISVFLRGGTNLGYYSSRSKLKDLSIWGSTTGATVGTTFAGVFICNNASFVEISQCDISGHLKYGLALDMNQNNIDCRNTSFTFNGDVTATSQGGGVISDVFNNAVSASLLFYNCWWNANVGFGVGGTAGKDPWTIIGGNFNNTTASAAFQSGTSMFVGGNNCALINVWSESASNLDLWVAFGNCTVIGGNFSTGNAANNAIFFDHGTLNIVGLSSAGHANTVTYSGTGYLSWSGVNCVDTTFCSTPAISAGQSGGVGSIGGGATYAPSLVTPSASVTVAGNAGTVPATASVSKVVNSSAAAMTVTMATSGAVDGQQSTVRIYDFSAATQTISWVNTENSTVSVPTTSNGSTTSPKTVTFQYNAATSKWRCVSVS